MVQGLAFLSKKSWHTKNLANQEKVWMAEEREKNEQRKAKELAKEIQIERENEELARLAAGGGSSVTTAKLDRGIDWMYTGHHKDSETAKQDAEKKAEEYLLGKEFRASSDSIPKGDFAVAAAAVPESLHIATTTQQSNALAGENEDSVFQRNEAFRLRIEDPMYAVTQRIAQTERKYEQRKELYERAGLQVRRTTTAAAAAEKEKDDRHHREKKHRRKDIKREEEERRKKRRHRSPSSSSSRYSSSIDENRGKQQQQHKSHRDRNKSHHHRHRSPSEENHVSDNRRTRRQESRKRHGARESSPDSRMRSSRESYSDRDYARKNDIKRKSKRDRSPSVDSYHDQRKRNKSSDRSRRKSRHDDDDHHHHYHSDDDDDRKPSSSHKNEEHDTGKVSPVYRKANGDGYGLQGGAAASQKRPTNHRDLGPDRDLLERKRAMKQAEREKLLSSSSRHRHHHHDNATTSIISQEERRAALESMQRDADRHHTKRSMQTRIYNNDDDDDPHESSNNHKNGGGQGDNAASFLHQIQRQAHGVLADDNHSSSISMAERMRQNRHKFQRPHEEEFL
jgi:hypothetical protein